MFSYQIEAFWAVLTPPVIFYLFGLPLACLYLLNVIDTVTGIAAAIRCKRFSWKVLFTGIGRFLFFYTSVWLIIFCVGIATTAISLLNVVMMFTGGLILTVSTTGIFSILCAVVMLSILDNLQEEETGCRNGFVGERAMFYSLIKAPFRKVAKQEQYSPPVFPTVPAAPTTTKGGDF